MKELQYLDELSTRVQAIFDFAIEARDGAQAAIDSAQSLKAEIVRRKIELQRAELDQVVREKQQS